MAAPRAHRAPCRRRRAPPLRRRPARRAGPVGATQVVLISAAATRVAASRGRGEPGRQNAVRHFVWQALITARLGLPVAQAVAEAQETGTPNAADSGSTGTTTPSARSTAPRTPTTSPAARSTPRSASSPASPWRSGPPTSCSGSTTAEQRAHLAPARPPPRRSWSTAATARSAARPGRGSPGSRRARHRLATTSRIRGWVRVTWPPRRVGVARRRQRHPQRSQLLVGQAHDVRRERRPTSRAPRRCRPRRRGRPCPRAPACPRPRACRR